MSDRKGKNVMSLFCDPSDPKAYGYFLAELLIVGGVQIETLAKGDQKIRFQDWCNTVRNATAGWKSPPADDHLEWLWEVLTTEPGILRELGGHILFREEEWKVKPTVTVLNSGHKLGVFLKGLATF
ncbi:MAG: hypothetical protein ND866_17130 [Pyrinomonadaceae bacterium]|nr:hypothetical protein [Pyrinomonadaceae bacterium]